MKINLDYKNKIKCFLRDEYGVNVTESSFKNGTNHPYIEFSYRGKRVRIILQSSKFETNIAAMKIQDIRRTLGPPLYAFHNNMKSQRSLEMMTKEVEMEARATGRLPETPLPSPQIQATGKMSFIAISLRKGYMLTISFPKEAREALGSSPLSITKDKANNIWEIKTIKEGRLHLSKRNELSTSNDIAFPEDKVLFGRSPVSMLISPGYVIVALDLKDRLPINVDRSFNRLRQKSMDRETPKNVAGEALMINNEAPQEVDIIKSPTSLPQTLTPSEMRALATEVVKMARELEERTPYRLALVRLPDGRKVWRAVADIIE